MWRSRAAGLRVSQCPPWWWPGMGANLPLPLGSLSELYLRWVPSELCVHEVCSLPVCRQAAGWDWPAESCECLQDTLEMDSPSLEKAVPECGAQARCHRLPRPPPRCLLFLVSLPQPRSSRRSRVNITGRCLSSWHPTASTPWELSPRSLV